MKNKLIYENCYIYVLDTLSDWEIAFLTAELNSRRYFNKNKKTELIMIGNTLKPIKTMGGIIITPDKDINNIEFQEGDILILPGADTWMDDKNKEILNIVSDVINRKVIIAAICGATVALAQIGLLDNRKHTSNDKDFLKMFSPNYKGSSHYINAPTVVDDNLITATGLAPLEFSYEIFKKINVMKKDTLEAWYQLYKTKQPKYFYSLMETLK
ncbi:type 1 glutamine amidotransferase family protein [Halocella sp. SP3-1]|uniref:type 1 glutamine amidotransferase family protein n=1 Tax=Halocella sp. SP3-1 TaxID=2382161 RepID=UPI000F76599B|nr:type 1 glutamine amidotransferase family protein [Halocella sp. SP3-1]AZO94887.1 glutamine amidotransferase [Halocella sp. SP3-1]